MKLQSVESARSAAEAIFSQPFTTAEARADPYPLSHQLREAEPVHHPNIEEGQAVVTTARKCVATVGENDIVGERGVLLGAARAATVTATAHMITYAISRERLRARVAGNSSARECMLSEITRRYPNLSRPTGDMPA